MQHKYALSGIKSQNIIGNLPNRSSYDRVKSVADRKLGFIF